MRLSPSLRETEALVAEHYAGASSPLREQKRDHRPLECAWWREPRKSERFKSDRHLGALNLYLALGRSSLLPLPPHSFPSTFDFSGDRRRNPDKGFVKMYLNAEPPILPCHMMQGHLVFVLTEEGQAKLETV
jgi:hypothetical protein